MGTQQGIGGKKCREELKHLLKQREKASVDARDKEKSGKRCRRENVLRLMS